MRSWRAYHLLLTFCTLAVPTNYPSPYGFIYENPNFNHPHDCMIVWKLQGILTVQSATLRPIVFYERFVNNIFFFWAWVFSIQTQYGTCKLVYPRSQFRDNSWFTNYANILSINLQFYNFVKTCEDNINCVRDGVCEGGREVYSAWWYCTFGLPTVMLVMSH
jgi:hypothetical protein